MKKWLESWDEGEVVTLIAFWLTIGLGLALGAWLF
jgi:hypothetical protein